MKKSFLYLILASFGYAAMIIPNKLLSSVSSIFLVWTAFLFTAIIGLLISYKNGFRISTLSLESKKYILIFSLTHALCSLCLNTSIKMLNATTALLLLYSAPLWIFLYLSIIKKHKLKFVELLAMSVALLGMFLVVNGDASISINGNFIGLTLALCSGIFYSADFLLGEKRPKELSSFDTTALIHLVGSIILLPGIMYVPMNLNFEGWVHILSFDVLLFVSFVFFLKGVNNINSLYASIITLTEPVFAAIMAYLWLNEKMSTTSIIGAVVLLSSIFFVDKLVIKLQTENHT